MTERNDETNAKPTRVDERAMRRAIVMELFRCAETCDSHDWNNQLHHTDMVNAVVLAVRPFIAALESENAALLVEVERLKAVNVELFESARVAVEFGSKYAVELDEMEPKLATAKEALRVISRTSEMSASIMRDDERTGKWEGSERVAGQFDWIATRGDAALAGIEGNHFRDATEKVEGKGDADGA